VGILYSDSLEADRGPILDRSAQCRMIIIITWLMKLRIGNESEHAAYATSYRSSAMREVSWRSGRVARIASADTSAIAMNKTQASE
jgi:hypothetical protein